MISSKPRVSSLSLSKSERHQRIVAELRANAALRVAQLATQFGVSTETIRRDLDYLARRGLLNRTYGGAAPLASEPSLNERYRLLVAERKRIAKLAQTLIEADQVLMIDAGSTTAHFAHRLAADAERLTVLTNGIAVATALATNPSLRVIICPGDYDSREGSISGPETQAFLNRFRADKCIIGASGLTVEGPVEANSGSAWVKQAMLERSDQHILLADQSKFDQASLHVVCPLSTLDDIVTDAPPGLNLAERIQAADVQLHIAKKLLEKQLRF